MGGVIRLGLFAACFGFVFTEVLPFRGYLRFKPFNCAVCMSGWSGLLFAALWYQKTSLDFAAIYIGIVCVSMVFSIALNKIIRTL